MSDRERSFAREARRAENNRLIEARIRSYTEQNIKMIFGEMK